VKHDIFGPAALCPLAAVAMTCVLTVAAPTASAQTTPFSATYTAKFVGPHGHPSCPDDAFVCGSGTAVGLGAYTTEETFSETCSCVINTLTFADGSALVLDETGVSFTGPGNSGSSQAPPTSVGHPGTYGLAWTVDSGTGDFAGATGSGTDVFNSAGLIAFGTLSGQVTTP
jgi:hypothetical protein